MKDRWDLLPWHEIDASVKVLTFGAQKYEDDNWKRVINPDRCYFAATLRHIMAREQGEIMDKESGLPHLAHAVCCLLFMMHFDKEKILGQSK